ncbi:MAG: 2OG-Fe(II) oxygenase [Litorimonas sp.]
MTFSLSEMSDLGSDLCSEFQAAEPWPHVVIDNFLPEHLAQNTLASFPDPDHDVWFDWTKKGGDNQFKKQGIGNASRLEKASPYIQHVLAAFQSYPFLKFLENLTQIPKLLPDPYMFGGGLHQILRGGHLKVHADFNELTRLDLYRRINVLYYLNENWKAEYNGELELWDAQSKSCVKSVAPFFNRLVVFVTDKQSLHGHPKTLNTPEGMTRKSLAFYYYTALPAEGTKYDVKTDWYPTEHS